MVKAIPESTRAHLEATFEIVLNLAKKVAPDIDANGDSNTFFAKVLDAVAFFYSYTPVATKEGTRPAVLYGTAGLKRAFGDMEVIMDDPGRKKQVKLTDIDDFMVFKWLLQESQRKVLSSWVKGAFATQGAAQAPASGFSKSRATAASDKKPKKAQQATAADLMSYFA